MASVTGEVAVVMLNSVSGGIYKGARKAGVEGQWEFAQDKRRHKPGRVCNRRRPAMQVWPLVM
jgi:hypothetical protein